MVSIHFLWLDHIFSIEEHELEGVEENLNQTDERQTHTEAEKSSNIRGECCPGDLLQQMVNFIYLTKYQSWPHWRPIWWRRVRGGTPLVLQDFLCSNQKPPAWTEHQLYRSFVHICQGEKILQRDRSAQFSHIWTQYCRINFNILFYVENFHLGNTLIHLIRQTGAFVKVLIIVRTKFREVFIHSSSFVTKSRRIWITGPVQLQNDSCKLGAVDKFQIGESDIWYLQNIFLPGYDKCIYV